MKRLLLVLLVLPLLAATSAEAKSLKWVKVCGPTDCTKTLGDAVQSPLIFPPWVMSDSPDPPPEHAARWLQVRVAFAQSDQRVRSVVVPRLGYAGGEEDSDGFIWQRLNKAEQRTYARLGRGVEGFSASTLPGLEEGTTGTQAAP